MTVAAAELPNTNIAPETITPPLPEEMAQLGQLALQQEVRERGERLRPGDPDQGFRMVHLEHRQPLARPVAATEALPRSYCGREAPEAEKESLRRFLADDFVEVVMRGDVHIDEPRPRESFVALDYPVSLSSYNAAVAEGRVKPGLFGPDGAVLGDQSEAVALDSLVEPDQKREVLHEAFLDGEDIVTGRYRDELEAFALYEPEAKKGLELIQAYDLVDGGDVEHGKSIRLLNFSTTLISEEQIRQAANVVRAYSDESGGAIFDEVQGVVVVKPDNPALRFVITDENGQRQVAYGNATRTGGLIVISERSLKESGVTEGSDAGYLEQYRVPGEPTEGPGSPKILVSGAVWEGTLAHEFGHAWPSHRNVRQLPGLAPTLYGRKDKMEHMAEVGAARYSGGEDALAVPDEQRKGREEEIWELRGGNLTTSEEQRLAREDVAWKDRPSDGLVKYREPLGPRFVTCVELDPASGPLPPRLSPDRGKWIWLPAKVKYHLVPDAPANGTDILSAA